MHITHIQSMEVYQGSGCEGHYGLFQDTSQTFFCLKSVWDTFQTLFRHFSAKNVWKVSKNVWRKCLGPKNVWNITCVITCCYMWHKTWLRSFFRFFWEYFFLIFFDQKNLKSEKCRKMMIVDHVIMSPDTSQTFLENHVIMSQNHVIESIKITWLRIR